MPLEQDDQYSFLYGGAAANLSAIRKSKSGIEGSTKDPLSESERKQRQEKESESRRAIRELRRASTTGNVSSWLKEYSAKKEAEFNARSATKQSTSNLLGSISYNRVSTEDGSSLIFSSSKLSQSSSPSINIPSPPSSGTYVLGSVNGVVTWIGTVNC